MERKWPGALGTLSVELPHWAEALLLQPQVMGRRGIRRRKNVTHYASFRHLKGKGCRPGHIIATVPSHYIEYNVKGIAGRVLE